MSLHFFQHVLYVFHFSAILPDIFTQCISTYSLYQASYIEADFFVKILIKPAVCNCSRFLRHYYRRNIRGLIL